MAEAAESVEAKAEDCPAAERSNFGCRGIGECTGERCRVRDSWSSPSDPQEPKHSEERRDSEFGHHVSDAAAALARFSRARCFLSLPAEARQGASTENKQGERQKRLGAEAEDRQSRHREPCERTRRRSLPRREHDNRPSHGEREGNECRA
jgi:hypothetical protein